MKFRLVVTIARVTEAVIDADDLADAERHAEIIQRDVAEASGPDARVDIRVDCALADDGTRSAP